jgi:hypothetical protein
MVDPEQEQAEPTHGGDRGVGVQSTDTGAEPSQFEQQLAR